MEKHFRIYEKDAQYSIQYRNYWGDIPLGRWKTLTKFYCLNTAKAFFGTQVELYKRKKLKSLGTVHAHFGGAWFSGY